MKGIVTSGVMVVIAGMFGAMVVGSVVRLVGLWGDTSQKARARRASLRTWWVLVILLALAVVAGPLGVCLLLGVAS